MKKKIIVITVSAVLLAALVLMLVLLLTKCSGERIEYDGEEKYEIGEFNRTISVSSIEIEWISGNVEIVYHYSSNFYCTEQSEQPIGTDGTMRYSFDGDTLRIKPCASGLRESKLPEKDLVIYIPVGAAFNDLDISTVSANVTLNQIGAEFLGINSESGNINIVHVGSSKNVKISTDSGNIDYSHALGRSESTEIATSSGELTVNEAFVSKKLKVTSDSGNMSLKLPSDAKLAFDVSNLSGITSMGGFSSTVVGDDISVVTLKSTSGNIILKKR